MDTKYVPLTDLVCGYASGLRSGAAGPLPRDLRAETAALGDANVNRKLAGDEHVQAVLLSVAGGIRLCRKR
jgi:hypothetical protein